MIQAIERKTEKVSDEELNQAQTIQRRYYYQWVEETAAGIIADQEAGELDDNDDDQTQQRIHEECDSAVIYTRDQYLIVAASEESEDAKDDMGDLLGGPNENFLITWAYCTFKRDLEDSIARHGGK